MSAPVLQGLGLPELVGVARRRRRVAAPRRRRRKPYLRVVRHADQPLPRLDGVTVLAVDDDPDARAITQQMLEPLGARVLVARHGDEALRILAREQPHVILCDLLMPRMDGFELIRRLRRDPGRAALPVIAVTVLGRDTDYYRTWEAGFDGHLSKPIDYAELAWVVHIIMRRRPVRRGGGWGGVGMAGGTRRRRRPSRPPSRPDTPR